MEKCSASSRSILAPASTNTLNSRQDLYSSPNKKRKRQDAETDSYTFEAKPISSGDLQRPVVHTFAYICMLPRASVPLSWLDTSSTHVHMSSGLLFNAELANTYEQKLDSEPSVLIGRLCPNAGLYAVEKVGPDTYIACALYAWVNLERVRSTTTGSKLYADLENLLQPSLEKSYHQVERICHHSFSTQSPKRAKNRRGVLARTQILPNGKSSFSEAARITTENQKPDALGHRLIDSTARISASAEDTVITPTPLLADVDPFDSVHFRNVHDEVQSPKPDRVTLSLKSDTSGMSTFDHLRAQYMETLYLSKTSLAYFAKGPLTRARIYIGDMPQKEYLETLCDFYRESILPPKKTDLKYKESINKVIESLPTNGHYPVCSDGEASLLPTTKAKKSRKVKHFGKNALYPGEDDYVIRWWQGREIKPCVEVSIDAHLPERQLSISDLRTRETEMQLLLVLELVALETSLPPINSKHLTKEPDVKLEMLDDHLPIAFCSSKRQKKKRDHKADLEALIDRLCIWHTVGVDGLCDSPENKCDRDTIQPSKGKDKLRDFCADVVIPFYAARLPELCRMICQRLGEPAVTPKRPREELKRQPTWNQFTPGTAIRSRARVGPRRTLERVLSEDLTMRHASPPVLSRAASVAQIPNLKREPSETTQRPASRGILYKSVSFTNREIDLVADAKLQDAKRRKLAQLADQKRELETAINNLKKPNRTKVAQGIMDDLAQRSMERKVTVKRAEQSLSISATPQRLKSRGLGQSKPSLVAIPTIEFPEAEEETVVPSSTTRPPMAARQLSHSPTSAKMPTMVSCTRGAAMPNPLDISRTGTNVCDWRSTLTVIQATPSASRLRPDLTVDHVEATPLKMTRSQRPVLFTPVRRSEVKIENVFRDAPLIPEKAGKAMDRVMAGGTEVTIYDSLGWNDEFD